MSLFWLYANPETASKTAQITKTPDTPDRLVETAQRGYIWDLVRPSPRNPTLKLIHTQNPLRNRNGPAHQPQSLSGAYASTVGALFVPHLGSGIDCPARLCPTHDWAIRRPHSMNYPSTSSNNCGDVPSHAWEKIFCSTRGEEDESSPEAQ